MERTYTVSWLKVEDGLGGIRPVLHGSVQETRSQFDGLIKILEPQLPAPSNAVETVDGAVSTIRYRIHTPTKPTQEPVPVGIYFHPGGFVIGQSSCDDYLCRALAEHTGSIIISVQYRLSPEHKAPAHLEDALKAVEWTHQNAAQLGVDATKIFVIGASAGAGLALCVARKIALRQSSLDPKTVKGIVALCPYTLHPSGIPQIYQSAHTSFKENANDVPMINLASLTGFFRDADLQPDDRDYFIALDQESHKLLPPTYIVTCEFDPLRDDGKVLAESLKAHGIGVKTHHYDGLPHCFWVFPTLPETDIFMGNVMKGTKWVIGQM